MSGPIVRSGPSSEYSKKWASVFGGKNAKSKSDAKPAAKKAAKKKKKKKSG